MSALRRYLFSDYLEDEEEIIFVAHRHFFVFMPDLFRISFFHIVIPVGFWFVFPQLLWLYIVWFAIGFIRFLFVLQDWYYDCWLITNMGVVGVEWTGYFERTSSRVEYQSIEGMSYTIKGVIRTIFNYGDVTLAKLGGATSVTLKDAYNPKRVERNLVASQEKYLESKNFTDQEVLKQLLSDLVVQHVKKHGLPDTMSDEEQKTENVKR
ncbi:hypothetical protein GF369_00015 [Candidatus Peregrinibacteria bacterium]|nr:hypothetical protein [Candidatus Peregrinibacteria bacterium]